jgi:hypothetical protein
VCASLKEIVIPPAVKAIHDTAFDSCTNLTKVRFCNEIEDFVSCDAMSDWWNQGVGKKSLRTYCFLVRCNIPARFESLSKVSSWQATIHNMLRIIPTIATVEDFYHDGLNDEVYAHHFDAIDVKLTEYENLLNEVPALFLKQFGLGESIALNILSYTDCEDDLETMQLANAATAVRHAQDGGEDDDRRRTHRGRGRSGRGRGGRGGRRRDVALEEVPEFFVYHGREYQIIPTDVIHIRIHSSVRAIKKKTFDHRRQLRIVILNEELEEIGEEAFFGNDSLEEIIIPNAVRAIKYGAFLCCSDLMAVTLGSGLEEIGAMAFGYCRSLGEIVIPNNIKEIDSTAFDGCTNLTKVKFSDEVEEFVSCNAISNWWNQGVGKKSLHTYCFLARCGIPARLAGLTKISSWQATIHNMLRIIPDIAAIAAVDNEESDDSDDDDDDDDSDADNDEINDKGMDVHFDAINARLTMYETLLNEVHVLFPEQYGLDEGTVLTVLSFL